MEPIAIGTRFKIYLRDQNQCLTCKRSALDGVELKITHITPKAAGGTNNIHNLRTLCNDCAMLDYKRSALVYAPLKKHNRIPPEYAIGILRQALKNYRSTYEKSSLNYEEAHGAANASGLVKGINPLFHPLPKSAVISAALVLAEEGKIKIADGKITII